MPSETPGRAGTRGGYCARDLIAATASGPVAAPDGVIRPIPPDTSGPFEQQLPEPFYPGDCTPGHRHYVGVETCLLTIGIAWREWQRLAADEGLVTAEGYAAVLPAYQYAASVLPSKDRAYLDAGLLGLDATPPGTGTGPAGLLAPKVVRNGQALDTKSSRRLFRDAWLEHFATILDAEKPYSSDYPTLPSLTPTNNGGCASTVADADRKVRRHRANNESFIPVSCAFEAYMDWQLYAATGDERFVTIAQGARVLAIKAHHRLCALKDPAKLFDLEFDCLTGVLPKGKCTQAGYEAPCN